MPAKMPQIREYMTLLPHTVRAEQPLKTVQQMMRDHEIRHLPVKKGGELVGIISDRVLKDAMASESCASLKAEDIMMPDPFTVSPRTSLGEVAANMAEEKYGSVLVRETGGELVGIFTTVDACRALRQLLDNTCYG